MSTDLVRQVEEVAEAAGKKLLLSFAEFHDRSSTYSGVSRDGMESRARIVGSAKC